jgi:predicted HAD superfamily hydrolase
MELVKIALLAMMLTAGVSSARAACVVHAEDPVIQQFFRANGIEVNEEKGDIQVEFEVTCEAVDQKKEKFTATEIHKTTTKLEVFNQYENQKVVYHSGLEEKKSGRVETAFVVPCADTREMKQKLLEASLESVKNINCNDEE